MKQKLNILFLASWYPSRTHPRLGNFIRRHAEAVSLLHKVCVVSAIDAGFDDIELSESAELFEIKVYFKKKLPVLSHYRAMQRGIAKSQDYFPGIHLVHVHVAFPAGLAALPVDRPFVVTEHFSGFHPQSRYPWPFLHKFLTRRILKKSVVTMPVSQFLKKAMAKFYPGGHYQVVPNVVNEKHFFPEATPAKPFTFLHISTLEERSKNISGLLQGVKILCDQKKDFKLKIGGDGDLEELQKKIDRTGIPAEHIELITEKPEEGIGAVMRESHSLLMFSHFETQSCTILEALCCGRPVVSSAVGGIPEIVNKDNGILVEPGNPEALASGMLEMMENYKRYDPSSIAAAAKSRFSYKAVGKQISETYFSVLKKAASNR